MPGPNSSGTDQGRVGDSGTASVKYLEWATREKLRLDRNRKVAEGAGVTFNPNRPILEGGGQRMLANWG